MYVISNNYASPQGTLVYPKQFIADTVVYNKSFVSPSASPAPVTAPVTTSVSASPSTYPGSAAPASAAPSFVGSNYSGYSGRYQNGEVRVDDEYEVEVQIPAEPVPPTMMVPMTQPDGSVQYVRAVHKGWTYDRSPYKRGNSFMRPVIVQGLENRAEEKIVVGTMC
eukprot:2525874-Rhodomonas_salina.2